MKDKDLLDATHKWPAVYRFKFIVPEAGVREFLQKLSATESQALETRKSENGRFSAYTLSLECQSSDEVLATYARFLGIPGLISL